MTAHAVEEVKLDTRVRILVEAERLFRHYGYTKTTVADIARELEMSPANVYRFFPSKSAIHEAIADRMLADRVASVLKISKLPLPASERLKIHAVESYRSTIETMLDEHKVHEMVMVAMDERWPVIDRHLELINEIVATMIADGIAAGEFADQDPKRAAVCFTASIIALCHPQVVAQCMHKTSRPEPAELADFAVAALRS